MVLSNFDLDAEPGVVEALLEGVRGFPDAGALAPSVIGADGVDQNPNLLRPPSTRRLRLLAAVHRFPVVADLLLRGTGRRSRTISGVPGGAAVFAAHGSCFVLTPRVPPDGGWTNYPLPLFGEELWIGEQCQRLGLTVRYLPSARLHHDSHVTTGHRRSGGWLGFSTTVCAGGCAGPRTSAGDRRCATADFGGRPPVWHGFTHVTHTCGDPRPQRGRDDRKA